MREPELQREEGVNWEYWGDRVGEEVPNRQIADVLREHVVLFFCLGGGLDAEDRDPVRHRPLGKQPRPKQ